MKVIRSKESYEGWLCGIRDEWEVGGKLKKRRGRKDWGGGRKGKCTKLFTSVCEIVGHQQTTNILI